MQFAAHLFGTHLTFSSGLLMIRADSAYVQLNSIDQFFKMEELPNRSPDIVVTALTLDDGEVAARRDFAQQ